MTVLRNGVAFTECFHKFSTIIPSTILLQANADLPNHAKRARMVEELWKRIVKRLLQFFDNYSPQYVNSEETKILRRFWGRIMEGFGEC
jgi:hypothetical protein